MLIDLHNHTARYSSCSDLEADELVARAAAAGLTGIAITEHDAWYPRHEARRLAARHGIAVFVGCELSTEAGHVLAFGPEDFLPATARLHDTLRAGREAEAALVFAHPMRWGGASRFRDDDETRRLFQLFDAVEVMSCNLDEEERAAGLALCARFGVAMCGGSDAHSLSMAAGYATAFERPLRDERDLARELAAGEFHPVRLAELAGP